MNSLTQRLWNTSAGSLTRALQRRLEQRKSKPGWHKVQTGPLAGAEILSPGGSVAWNEMVQGTYDGFLYDAVLARRHPRGTVVWDIGAHFGYHSLAFAALGAEVVAFEPNACNAKQLRLNLERNPILAKRVRHLAVAVSDNDGEMTFLQSDDLTGSSMGSHLTTALPPLDKRIYTNFERKTVPTARIDSLLDAGNERAPDIVKIDVEGAEALVLEGGSNFFCRSRPILLMEIHHICLMFAVQKLLLDWGYGTRLLDEAHASPSRCFILAEAVEAEARG